MSTRHRLLCFLFLLAAHATGCRATGCRATHGVVDERHTAQLAVSPVGVKTQRSIFAADSIAVYTSSKDASPRNTRDASAAPKSLINKATDAIGLSTPEGRARRQARKDAAATVPRSMGKGAVWAPNAQQVANAFKSDAPTSAAAPNAIVSNAAENSQQQVVPGDNNQLKADKHDTTQQAKDWKAELATPVGKAVAMGGLLLALACTGGFCYYLIPLLPKRRKDPVA